MRTSHLALATGLLFVAACKSEIDCDTTCLREHGQLCEAGQCVDPWRYGAPEFSACEDDPHRTAESLEQKATQYDAIARRLHLHPQMKWSMRVRLKPSPNDPSEPVAQPNVATQADVASYGPISANEGLWSALYLASQAFRYAVTHDAEALDNIQVLLEGERLRMGITGVPGLFANELVLPGASLLSCPAEDAFLAPDPALGGDSWIQVRDDGCFWQIERATKAWRSTGNCGHEAYAGACWHDDVSKDDYSAHWFALGAVSQLVDDTSARAAAADLLGEIADHLRKNSMQIIDWNGRRTGAGAIFPLAGDDNPGFNAAMGLAAIRLGADATGREDLRDFYDRCLQKKVPGKGACAELKLDQPDRSYASYLPLAGLYVGADGCQDNYNNISMHILSMVELLMSVRDPAELAVYQRSFDVDVMRPLGQQRPALDQHNAWFDFFWAAYKKHGPGSDGPAYEAVKDGVCMLRQFPASYSMPTRNPPSWQTVSCNDRFDNPISDRPRETFERCPFQFIWWSGPYDILANCTEDKLTVVDPQGYLLPYWMGRYFGFIPEGI